MHPPLSQTKTNKKVSDQAAQIKLNKLQGGKNDTLVIYTYRALGPYWSFPITLGKQKEEKAFHGNI